MGGAASTSTNSIASIHTITITHSNPVVSAPSERVRALVLRRSEEVGLGPTPGATPRPSVPDVQVGLGFRISGLGFMPMWGLPIVRIRVF